MRGYRQRGRGRACPGGSGWRNAAGVWGHRRRSSRQPCGQTSCEWVSVRLRCLRADVERVPEVLDALEECGHVLVRVRQPGLQEALHLLGETRVGVTVEELRDRLRSGDDLGRLLLEGRIAARVRVLPGSDAVRVGDEEGDLCGARAEVLEERERGVLVGGERR